MNDYFHQCLAVCRNLHNQGVSLNPEINPHAAAITADKLIYSYAIEMVSSTALIIHQLVFSSFNESGIIIVKTSHWFQIIRNKGHSSFKVGLNVFFISSHTF
jgi:hypothetical protein